MSSNGVYKLILFKNL